MYMVTMKNEKEDKNICAAIDAGDEKERDIMIESLKLRNPGFEVIKIKEY